MKKIMMRMIAKTKTRRDDDQLSSDFSTKTKMKMVKSWRDRLDRHERKNQ